MSDEQIYMVNVEVHFEMMVVASSKEAAEKIAEDHYEEDLRDQYRPGVMLHASPIKKCPKDWRGSLPWGELPTEDPREQWTVDQWLAETPEA